MRHWTSLACAAALIAGCAENRPSRTADNERTERTTNTETMIERASEPDNRPGATTEPAPAHRSEVAPAEPLPGNSGAAAALPPATGPADGDRYPTKTMNADGAPADRPTSADNTRVNKRDTDDRNLTPMDQGTSASDRNITAEIRKAVVGDGGLSFTAKNVKIITRDGNVVLRGPVKTEAEKASIQAAAARVAGAGRVNNQLEIAK